MSQWKPLYLKFSSKEDMMTSLEASSLTTISPDSGEEIIGGNPLEIRINVLGVLQEPTGAILEDEEGNEYPEMAPVDGYHVNVLVHPDHYQEYLYAFEDVVINPTTPKVKYAGV